MSVTVQRLRADEVALLRKLRLAALRDSPDAFGRTLAEALAQPDSAWIDMARGCAEGPNAAFVAEDAGRGVGLVFGIRKSESLAHLGGMWVAPEARGTGIGRALVRAVLTWARGEGFMDVGLWVTDGNDGARALYERLGFVPTGARDTLQSNAALEIVEMATRITAGVRA